MHETIRHDKAEIDKYARVTDQYEFRQRVLLKVLEDNNIPFDFDVIVGRGGLVRPIVAGVYEINDKLMEETNHPLHQHACNLGSIMAYNLAKKLPNCRALTADPAVVDELCDEARITGLPDMPRVTMWHCLNQRAIARRYAKEHGTKYEDVNLIVVHMGGGVSLAAHEHGRAIDANNALTGEGPFSVERCGSLPFGSLIELCYSGKYATADEMVTDLITHGGLIAHLGTNNMQEILRRIDNGDDHARLVVDAMAYQIAKSIGGLATVLKGKVDAILLTGGLAYERTFTDRIEERVGFIAPVCVYPGEDELSALAMNAYLAVKGELPIKEYV